MINRRSFISKSAASVVVASRFSGSQQNQAQPDRVSPAAPNAPNILIFMPDQQNGGTVLPGSPVIKPHMDGFLKEAVTFNSAYCPAPHCCPSRTSFLSGVYPSEHGVFNNVTTETAIHANPNAGTPFWGRWLKDAGYQMGYAGKLHVGRDVKPEDCGFTNVSSLEQDSLAANQKAKHTLWRKAQSEKYAPANRKPGEILREGWTNLELYKTLPDEAFEAEADYRIAQAGIAAMQNYAARGGPWCVMISNSGAHDPYNAPKRFVEQYKLDDIKLPASFSDTMDDKPRIYQRQRYQHWSQLSDTETRDALRHYYAKCTMQDEIFGRILAALERTGQKENTIVLYVSDHGDYMGSHGLWFKGVPAFSEAYNIPAVIRWPKGVSQPGRQVGAFVDQVDFGPTLLEAAGLTPPQKLSGQSLMPFLKAEKPATWRKAFHSQMNGVELYYTQRIVMTKQWKYVYNGFDYDELYDLESDPFETKNLAFPDLSAKRSDVLKGAGLKRDAQLPWPPLPSALDQVRRELLQEMWAFASEHKDMIFNPYGTVSMAPYGPGIGPEPQ